MSEKIHKLRNGLEVTLPELLDMFDSYTMQEVFTFRAELMEYDTRVSTFDYCMERLARSIGM